MEKKMEDEMDTGMGYIGDYRGKGFPQIRGLIEEVLS